MQAAGADAWPAQDVVLISKFFIVAKRISLFLARKWPQMTIDHLVYEISYMLRDEDALPARSAPISQVCTKPPPKTQGKTRNDNQGQCTSGGDSASEMDERHICCWVVDRLQLCACHALQCHARRPPVVWGRLHAARWGICPPSKPPSLAQGFWIRPVGG